MSEVAAKNSSCLRRFKRLLRYRLLIPIERNLSRPKEVARGASLGLGIGLTPTVGIQLFVVTCVWTITRLVGIRVNLASAFAWTFVSNPITMFPLYFVFYITGEFMLFRKEEMMVYQGFSDVFAKLLIAVDITYGGVYQWVAEMFGRQRNESSTDWHVVTETVMELFDILIYPIFLGSVPWMVAGFVLGYVMGFRIAKSLLSKRRRFRELGQ